MNPINSASAQTYQLQQKGQLKAQDPGVQSKEITGSTTTDKVSISNEAKERLAQAPQDTATKETKGNTVESFAYGALGMDHPDTVKEQNDPSYTAGQYVSAAATIGGLLLMLI
ncbi:hypothetical protein JCM19233_3137 [Vibrio astriarenae]|nr:hypothetical protein JCM19233_3137 [Vibrio sp. C7]